MLANQGLTEYIDDSFIRNTSRELTSAINVSPVVLNAAADILIKEQIKVQSIIQLLKIIITLPYVSIQGKS